MSRITDWAERRWVERFVDGDNPGLQVANEMLVYSKYEREVEQRRVALYATLNSLGADASVLRELDAFEAASGVLGVLIGASMEIEAAPPPVAPTREASVVSD